MEQLIAHLVGDFVLQSHWMANEKTKRSVAAAAHVATYVLPFLLITRSPAALAVIAGTHFVIDRWRLARYVCWVKNFLAPLAVRRDDDGKLAVWTDNPTWSECSTTGYPPDTPPWLATWLMIWADQAMHLALNYAALRWLA